MMYYKADYNLSGSFKSQSPSDTSYPMLLDALGQVSISRKFFISLVTYSENSGICLGGFIFDADLFRGAFLSDVLHPGQNSIGGKKDLWLVVFNDVVLRHQRTGITSPPSCVFYKFKYEFVARATSERQVCYHRTQRGAYQTPESL